MCSVYSTYHIILQGTLDEEGHNDNTVKLVITSRDLL